MPVPIAQAKTLDGYTDGLEQRVCLDFDLVLNSVDVAVPDPAERHGGSVAFRLVFTFGDVDLGLPICLKGGAQLTADLGFLL